MYKILLLKLVGAYVILQSYTYIYTHIYIYVYMCVHLCHLRNATFVPSIL